MIKLLNKFSRKFYRKCFWIWLSLLTILSVWPFKTDTEILIKGFKIRLDYLEHLGFYFVLGFLFVISSSKKLSLLFISMIFFIGLTYGFLMEFIQAFIPKRTASIYDMLLNMTGIILGLALSYFYFDKHMEYRKIITEI